MSYEPTITIGGVPIVEQSFSWALTPGAAPYISSIVVPMGTLNDAMKSLISPVDLVIDVWGSNSQGKVDNEKIVIKEVYLLQGKEGSKKNAVWRLADKRWLWRGHKVFGSYNKTRAKNDLIEANTTIDSSVPSTLRQEIDKYRAGRYVEWSIQEDGHPWTIRQMLQNELCKVGVQLNDPTEDVEDVSSYILENIEYNGVPFYSAISDLLTKSRMQLGILRDGTFDLYSIDFFDTTTESLLGALAPYSSAYPGVLYNQELSRERPRTIRVMFEKKKEVRFVGVDTEKIYSPDEKRAPLSVPANGQSVSGYTNAQKYTIGAVNVIQTPVPLVIGGRKLNIGEWTTMSAFLRALGVSHEKVRQLWFSGALKAYISNVLGDPLLNDPLAGQVERAIRNHYRQTYQVDPYWMDRIEKIEARLVSIQDNYSRYSPPSPLYADYCLIPRNRRSALAKSRTSKDTWIINWKIAENDPQRNQPVPGSVTVVDRELGIFRVVFPPSLDRTVSDIVPSYIVDAAKKSIAEGVPGAALFGIMHLADTYTFEAIMSVMWSVGSNDRYDDADKYYVVPIDCVSQGGAGPDIEFLCRKEYARYATPEITQGGGIVDMKSPVNYGLLQKLAKAEAGRMLNRYRDRISGLFSVAGFVNIKLIGNISYIMYTFSPAAGLETKIDMTQHPYDPTLEQQLDQDTINFLHKHVSRADGRNHAIG